MRPVAAAGQIFRQESIVGDQRETAVDDMKMAVEERKALELRSIRHSGCSLQGLSVNQSRI